MTKSPIPTRSRPGFRFEAGHLDGCSWVTRLARQCLVEAYTRLVPIRRKALKARHVALPSAAAAADQRGGEHG
jgi:hypothetical protein